MAGTRWEGRRKTSCGGSVPATGEKRKTASHSQRLSLFLLDMPIMADTTNCHDDANVSTKQPTRTCMDNPLQAHFCFKFPLLAKVQYTEN